MTSSDIICQKPGTTSSTVIPVAAGDRVGAWFQHVIGGAQFPNDADNPIAKSHKGPVTAWLAKVGSGGSAATADKAGQRWFKIWEDTFDTATKTWGVDNMIAQNGWVYFPMPACIAPGDYLMRVEILALHSAKSLNAAQFYSKGFLLCYLVSFLDLGLSDGEGKGGDNTSRPVLLVEGPLSLTRDMVLNPL